MRAFARLKAGVTIPQAEAALQPLFADSLNYFPPRFRNEIKLRIRSLNDRQSHDARLASWLLLVSVLAVLLIACANVATLLLARGSGRQRELATRSALGATRLRLARQALTESLLLGALGGLAGLGLGWLLCTAGDAGPSHDARSAIGVRNAVSTTSSRLMPSTPTK